MNCQLSCVCVELSCNVLSIDRPANHGVVYYLLFVSNLGLLRQRHYGVTMLLANAQYHGVK